MPAKTEKQRKFMGAELQRKREDKKTRTDMSESEPREDGVEGRRQGEELAIAAGRAPRRSSITPSVGPPQERFGSGR